MSHTTMTDPPAFERDVHATVVDLEDKQNQMLDQIYENRSHSTTQHQMLEATVHYLEQQFIEQLGGMFMGFRTNDNRFRAIQIQLTTIGNQIQAVQALAGHIPELKDQLTKTKDTMEKTIQQVASFKIDLAGVDDQVSSVKHDMATIHELEYLKGDLADVVNQVGCIQDTIDNTVGTHRIEFQAEERAIYLEHRAEYGGVPEYQAEALGQAAMPDDPASLAWQLRNLKARVIHLEKVASNHLRNQVNATVRGQQSFQSDLQRLQTDQQRLQARVAGLISALGSLNPDLASLSFSEPSPHSSLFSSGPTTVTSPSPPNNHEILSTEEPVEFQQLTESAELETDTIHGNPTLEIHRGKYQAPTVEDFTELDESPTITRSPPKKLNPEAAPFVFAPISTHDFTTSSDNASPSAFEMDQSNHPAQKASNDDADKRNEKKPYNEGRGLEDSMWNPKNKNAPRQNQPRQSRAMSIRRPFGFGTLTLGDQDVTVESTPAASSQQRPSNETVNEWFTAMTSVAQPPSGEVPNQGGNLTEDPNQLIPGLEESSASRIVGSGPDLSAVSAMSLLDDNGDVSDISIPVLTQTAPTQNTEATSVQPADVHSFAEKVIKKIAGDLAQRDQQNQGYGLKGHAQGASGNVDDAADAHESGTHDVGAAEIIGSTSSDAANDQIQGAEVSVPVIGEVATDENPTTMITFSQVKIRVQAGKSGPFVIVGRLNKEAFDLMNVKLVILIEKAQPMKVKIVGTIKGGKHDGEDAGVAEFIIPTYIKREEFSLMSRPAAEERHLSAGALIEFNALKAAAGGEITGNIHRLTFDYTAPNVTNNMEIFKPAEGQGAQASGDQALAKQFFTALCYWSGGHVSMLFLDEANDSQLVGEVLGELKEQCTK